MEDKEKRTSVTDNNAIELCPICMDPFHQPKLLPCCHTICQECLQHMFSNSQKRQLITCPICRKEVQVPSGKVENFFSNYFIYEKCESTICNVCLSKSLEKLIGCSSCGGQLCYKCYKRHRHSNHQRIARVDSVDDDEELLGNDLSHRHLSRSLLHQLKGKAQTVFGADTLFSIFCGSNTCVTTILPVDSLNSLWVVYGQHISLYNSTGSLIHSKQLACTIKDIALWENNSLLIIFEEYKSVMTYREPEIVEYVNVGNNLPICMVTLENGTLILAVSVVVSPLKTESMLMIYNNVPRKLYEYGCTKNGLSFANIVSLCCNLAKGQLCVADFDYGVVYLLREDDCPLKYKAKRNMPVRDRGGQASDSRYQGFKPRSLCSNSDGHIFIYDDACGLIHVIDSTTKLLGIILTNDVALSGNPKCIAMPNSGHLYIGDSKDGYVRVYELLICFNNLGCGEDDILESLRQRLIGRTDTGRGLDHLVNVSRQLQVPPEVVADAVFSGDDNIVLQ